ncbi:hypothetical protein FOIG_14355 [Fusarium odoratissimum NRRL 54006]|uniref:NACHT domain-containing protein n=2 Tax=Fusarium oxysporum species complex TaxID=171631 RepID=X0J8H2_FUSO5|nr:uncharacterized protein FOIG_14355 [Fusarium odoratissimum NRRL 54006]EXL92615.1 hypothetical protein FOIG_14355 [Fusarium odoratissimum NRRL 54006]TXB97575.1 hypothetical protein FocTR4_00011538 [Fusarium oxysporum f. sp. cubense]
MDGLSSAVNIISIIDTSIKVIKWCYDYADEFKNEKEERKRLLSAVSGLKLVAEKVRQIIKTPRGERLEASRELQNTTENGKKSMKNLEDKLCKSGKVARILWPLKKQGIEDDIQAIEKCTQIIHQVLQIDIADILLDVNLQAKLAQRKAAIESLPLAEGAAFDSQAEQHNPGCLKNTRVALLAQIAAWIEDENAKTIFWLNGMAGTGKSTISRTVAASAQRKDKLGATFFFKQGETDRGSLTKFFTTLARHLAANQPAYTAHLVEMISNDTGIFEKTSQVQFKRLIIDPIVASAKSLPDSCTITIVIDALDECEKAEDIKLLVDLLSQTAIIQKPKIRVLITSRPELPVRLGFSAVEGAFQNCILHQMPQNVVEQDIATYLRHDMSKIRKEWNASVAEDRRIDPNWPESKDIGILAKRAAPLFIFAATMCRFVGDRKLGSPDKQLLRLLAQNNTSDTSRMGLVYSPALNQLIAGASETERKDILRRFFRIIGTIICLASPLSTTSLSRFLGTPRDEIDLLLDNLHSVLSIPTTPNRPVRMLHLSFRDYLLDRSNRVQNPFWISGKEMSRYLTKVCLATMKIRLKVDICGVRSPETKPANITRKQVTTCLPPEVQYACLYWSLHLQLAGLNDDIISSLEDFFKNRLLMWMEALILMGRAWQISGLLKGVKTVLQKMPNDSLAGFVPDALRFLQANISVISSNPLQIYCGLVFNPENSVIRKAVISQVPKWITSKPSVAADWNSCLQVLEGHKELVNAVAFSPDSKLLISTSNDRSIRAWHWDTGECIHEFKDQQNPICSSAMSPDGRTVATASNSGVICIWSLTTGSCLATLGAEFSDTISSIAFSPNSKSIYTLSSDMGVRCWDVGTKRCTYELPPRPGAVGTAVFSPDLKSIAFWSRDNKVELRDVNTGKSIIELTGYQRRVKEVTFSPNSKYIAVLSDHSTFRIWDRDAPQKCLHQFSGHKKRIKMLTFSPNSKAIASGSEDNSVRVWDIVKGISLAESFGFGDGIERLLFSPDSKFLTSASMDCTMVTWNWATDESVGILQGHSGLVTSMLFSPDSSVLASFSVDQTIRIWDWKKGVDESNLHHDFGKVVSLRISPDGTRVATLSADKKVRVWSTATSVCLQELDWGKYLYPEYPLLGSPIPFFSHDSAMVGLSPVPQTSRIWNIENGEEVLAMDACHPAQKVYLFPSSDSQRVAVVPQGKEAFCIWHMKEGKFVLTQALSTPGYEAFKILFTPDLKIVIASLLDVHETETCVWAWDLTTAKRLWTKSLPGFGMRVDKSPLAMSIDGFCTAAILGETLQIWQTETGNILREISIPRVTGSVCSELSLTRHLVGLLFSGDVHIWEWQSKKCTHEISGLGAGSRNFRILGIGESIQTNLGEAPLPAEWSWGRSAVEMPFYPELSFDIKTCWVQYRGKDLLRLPAECRDSIYEVHGFTLAVGCQTGRVLIIGLNKAELEKSIGTPKQEPPPQKIREYGAYRAFGSRPTSPTDSWSDGWSS